MTRSYDIEMIADELVQVGHEMERKGLIIGSVGNISARVNRDTILISSRSSFLGRLKREELIPMSTAGEKLVDSSLEPSSELFMHLEIYRRRRDIGAIVHTHSPYASAYAFLKRPLRAVNPESQYVLGKIPIISFFPSGTKELALAVANKLVSPVRVALMEKHGVISVGESAMQALNLAEMLEETARINFLIDVLEKK